MGAVHVLIDAKFGNDHGKVIADAVGLLPDPIRAQIDGITVASQGPGKGPGGRSGDYRAANDTVELWDDLFADSSRRLGMADNAAYQVVHELGHAVDLRPRFQAQRARDKASAAKAKLQTELRRVNPDAPIGREGDVDQDDAEKRRIRAEIARLDTEIDAQGRASLTAKSIAGSETGGDTEELLTDFGKALTADGVRAVTGAIDRNTAIDAANKAAIDANKANPTGPQRPLQPHGDTLTTGVSNYGATNLSEAFAENFAAYVLDEALLKAIRPKTAEFFARRFPKTVPPGHRVPGSRSTLHRLEDRTGPYWSEFW